MATRDRLTAGTAGIGRLAALLGALAASTILLLTPQHSIAQDTEAAARAYRRAQAAELEEQFHVAAEFYELADSLAPSPQALRAAMRSRLAAGEEALAATHADTLLRRYATDARSRQAADEVLSQVGSHLARVSVRCRPVLCTLFIDSHLMPTGELADHVVYVTPGTHTVGAEFGSVHTDAPAFEAEAGHELTVEIERPEEEPPPPAPVAAAPPTPAPAAAIVDEAPPSGHGIDPAFFFVGVGLTAVAGAVLTWSGVDTLDARSAYDANPSPALYADGHGRMDRTNALIGVTAGLGVTTLILALVTDWGGHEPPSRAGLGVDLVIDDGFAMASFRGAL